MAILNVAAIAAVAAKEIPLIIKDGVIKELGGTPNFIAEGVPESVAGKIGQAGARSACRQYAAGQSGLTGEKAVRAERACRPYLDTISPGGAAGVATPFQGGQCPKRYLVSWTVQTGSSCADMVGFSLTQEGELWGPIIGTYKDENTCPPGGAERGPVGIRAFSVLGGPRQSGPVNAQVNGSASEITINSVQVIFSGAGVPLTDDCGDPPPEIIPPRVDPDNQPPGFRFNPDGLIDVPITIDFNPDGSINFDIGTGPINIDPFGDDDGAGGGGGGSGGAQTDPGTPGTPQDTGPGGQTGADGEVEGEAPPGQFLTALKLDILEAPPSRVLYSGVVDRGAAYVYMGTSEGLALDPTGGLLRDPQLFVAQADFLTNWRVRARFGYNIRVTPYYREDNAE